jgi:hypothetical protein
MVEEPLVIAERVLRDKTGKYIQHKEDEARRIREEEIRKARAEEEARRAAEAERVRIETERLRLEAEQAANAWDFEEEEKIKEEVAIISEETAIALETPIVSTPIKPLFVQTPKVEGLTFKEVWNFEIIDKNLIPSLYMEPNMTAIGAAVRTLKDQTNIAGIRVYSTKQANVRSAK